MNNPQSTQLDLGYIKLDLKLKTILNFKKYHSHFVYQDIRLVTADTHPKIEVKVVPRKGRQGICSGCGKKRPGYDRLKQRAFIHVPLWGIAVVFLYCMRRLHCPTCGIIVESVPWGSGKSPLTKSYS